MTNRDLAKCWECGHSMSRHKQGFCQHCPCNKFELPSDSGRIELQAWRYLAAHRVGALQASYLQFFDDAGVCRMNTPSSVDIGCSESGAGSTFGEAAIGLALALGMACQESDAGEPVTDSDTSPSDDAGNSSSAPTATRPSGETRKNSRRTRSPRTGSTTGATGVGAATDASGEPACDWSAESCPPQASSEPR